MVFLIIFCESSHVTACLLCTAEGAAPPAAAAGVPNSHHHELKSKVPSRIFGHLKMLIGWGISWCLEIASFAAAAGPAGATLTAASAVCIY